MNAGAAAQAQTIEISESNRAACEAVRAYADSHRIGEDTLRAIVRRTRAPVGDDPNHVVELAGGIRCVFSIEEMPFGWARHLSISVHGKLPATPLADVLMQWFGFHSRCRPDESVAFFFTEDFGSGLALNVIEPLAH